MFTDTQEWVRFGNFVLNWFSFGGFLGLLNPVYMVVNRSLMSQAVSSDEIGRINSVLALFAAVCTSLVSAGWQKLYNLTLATVPGTYLIVVTIITAITIPTNLIMKRFLSTFTVTDTTKL